MTAQRTGNQAHRKQSDVVKRLCTAAVYASLTTIMTAYILHIPIGGNGGYIHLGDTIIYLAAASLPLPYACLVGAVGGGFADLLTAPAWAPATVIIKMLVCLPFSSKGKTLINRRNILACVAAVVISTTGYYLAEGILFGFKASIFTSLGPNAIQSGGSMVAFILVGKALDKLGFKERFFNS